MSTINKSLLWIMNHKELNNEIINEAFNKQSAVTRVQSAAKSDGLVFVDYRTEEASLPQIANNLRKQGLVARIISI